MDQAKRFPIVGIGASAGGVEALQALFGAMPRDMPMAFVVVTHLGPDRESYLPQIIASCTTMPIAPAHDGDTILMGHAYILSTDAVLTIDKGRIGLHSAEGGVERNRHPIDTFLMSLSADQGDGAVGILLSGGGSDGTLGLKSIRSRGGLTLAQGSNGTSPRYHSMPDTAVASGAVDLFIPVEEMPARLSDFAANLQDPGPPGDPADDDAEADAARATIGMILRTQIGHDFLGYKARTFMRGVRRRMKLVQMTDLPHYIERLRADPKEAAGLFQELLIGVTAFFRDAEAFDTLATEVIPHLLAGRGADDTVRIWLPACATGEEAYSLAILLLEQLGPPTNPLPNRPKVQIFATDIDEPALAVARIGHYPAAAVAHLSPERIARFFDTDGLVYSVSQELRGLCIFSAQSVIRDAPFSRMDLISCRNLLIYLGAELQTQIIPIFHFALSPGGYLFLGVSENIGRHGDLFDTVSKRHRIFRRNERILPPRELARIAPLGASTRHSWLSLRTPQPQQGETGPALREAFETLMLAQYAPPSVVVNRDGDVVYQGARLGRYLEIGIGAPSHNLMAMVRRGLRSELRGALRQATDSGQRVIRPSVELEIDDVRQVITLTVAPVPDRDKASPLFLVIFGETAGAIPDPLPGAVAGEPGEAAIKTAQLERELRDSRERLQSQVEEYETAAEELRTANEELVSFNEEQQSINEELETSREELQSINEELRTVNLELGAKIEELDGVNTDLRNLFDSTQIATIFLDRHLIIRNFTPAVTRIFNLVPTDRGRPLSAFASRIEPLDLRADVRRVLDERELVERRVSATGGDVHYMMRLLPYMTTEGTVDGVVLTFVDITSVVEREELRTLVGELNHRVRNMLQVVMAVSRHTLRQSPTLEAFGKSFLGRLQALGRAHELVSRNGWSQVSLIDLLRKETEPYSDIENRLSTTGPVVLLNPKAAVALGLTLHEIATNSVKYGSLSVGSGRVAVTWSVDDAGHGGEGRGAMLTLEWIESGGPKVMAPTRRGLGSDLIERQVRGDLSGTSAFDFAEAGLRITLCFPVDAGAEALPLQPEAAIEWTGADPP